MLTQPGHDQPVTLVRPLTLLSLHTFVTLQGLSPFRSGYDTERQWGGHGPGEPDMTSSVKERTTAIPPTAGTEPGTERHSVKREWEFDGENAEEKTPAPSTHTNTQPPPGTSTAVPAAPEQRPARVLRTKAVPAWSCPESGRSCPRVQTRLPECSSKMAAVTKAG